MYNFAVLKLNCKFTIKIKKENVILMLDNFDDEKNFPTTN